MNKYIKMCKLCWHKWSAWEHKSTTRQYATNTYIVEAFGVDPITTITKNWRERTCIKCGKVIKENRADDVS